jgi:3-hydroxyacyl-CoA dehydrogenase
MMVVMMIVIWRGSGTLVQDGIGRIRANLLSRVKKGRMAPEAADKALSLVQGALTFDDFKSADMVCPPPPAPILPPPPHHHHAHQS